MEAEVEIFKSKAVSSKADRNTETVIFRGFKFLAYPSQILETQRKNFFPRTYFTYETADAYLSLFMVYWNIQENLDSEIFWAGDGQFCGDLPPLYVWHGTRLAFYWT